MLEFVYEIRRPKHLLLTAFFEVIFLLNCQRTFKLEAFSKKYPVTALQSLIHIIEDIKNLQKTYVDNR